MSGHLMMGVLGRGLGPRISLGPEGMLVEQYKENGDARVGPASVTVTEDKLYVGCTTISAAAVEALIKKWRERHPEETA